MGDSLIRCRCGRALPWERLVEGVRGPDGIRCYHCIAAERMGEMCAVLVRTGHLPADQAEDFVARGTAWVVGGG